ncbi:MAG TPA: hypothetical protein P5548_01235 [Candidatus Moranbacteria bacterium]|nr:hypothetical protein [Candidatus Moranbacteria bacterium]HRZ33515.1 hypothetical protein [Candidatus Moranbacteria bacterium]
MNIKKKTLGTIISTILLFPMSVLAADGEGWQIGDDYGLPTGTISGILEGLLNWLLGIFAVLGVIGFIISGIMYLVSAGDEDGIARAKKAMIYSLIGIIVGLSGIILIAAVDSFLMGSGTF